VQCYRDLDGEHARRMSDGRSECKRGATVETNHATSSPSRWDAAEPTRLRSAAAPVSRIRGWSASWRESQALLIPRGSRDPRAGSIATRPGRCTRFRHAPEALRRQRLDPHALGGRIDFCCPSPFFLLVIVIFSDEIHVIHLREFNIYAVYLV